MSYSKSYEMSFSDRHKPEPKDNMIGVTIFNKRCYCCKGQKKIGGSKNVDIGTKNRVFVCGDCVSEGKHLELSR